MSLRMLRRASVAVLFLVLVPQTVQAFDHHFHDHHHSSSGGGCGGSDSSTSGSTSSTTQAPTPTASGPKRVFITSATYTGALGGTYGADDACARGAMSGGLPGAFRAWISDGSMGPLGRLADVGPWYTTGDVVAFTNKSDLAGAPRSELLDEYGGHAEGTGAWSGSDARGAATGDDCDAWTSAATEATGAPGSAFAIDTTWGGGEAPRSCAIQAPLICFQQ